MPSPPTQPLRCTSLVSCVQMEGTDSTPALHWQPPALSRWEHFYEAPPSSPSSPSSHMLIPPPPTPQNLLSCNGCIDSHNRKPDLLSTSQRKAATRLWRKNKKARRLIQKKLLCNHSNGPFVCCCLRQGHFCQALFPIFLSLDLSLSRKKK